MYISFFQATGKPKVTLHDSSCVYVTQQQLELLNGMEWGMAIVTTLNMFFPLEVLATSCAKGDKVAVNRRNEAESTPLPKEVVEAIVGKCALHHCRTLC